MYCKDSTGLVLIQRSRSVLQIRVIQGDSGNTGQRNLPLDDFYVELFDVNATVCHIRSAGTMEIMRILSKNHKNVPDLSCPPYKKPRRISAGVAAQYI